MGIYVELRVYPYNYIMTSLSIGDQTLEYRVSKLVVMVSEAPHNLYKRDNTCPIPEIGVLFKKDIIHCSHLVFVFIL